MSYDHTRTRDLLKIAQAHTHTVMGEVLGMLATQVIDAEAEISALIKSAADVRGEADEANRRLMTESAAHRATKEKADANVAALTFQKTDMIEALTKIAQDARGAKTIAQDALAKINLATSKSAS